jgi:hypothetical protein
VPVVFNKCLRALSDQDENRREEFVGAALATAAAALIPVLEGTCHVRDLGLYVQAAASLLEARNDQRATAAADAELLHLAAWSRILAREARSRMLAKDAVESLDRRWYAFLSNRNLRILELLATDAGSSNETVTRVEYWLDLLEEEIAVKPPPSAQEDPRFKLFIRLAWWRWVAGGDGNGWWAVCAKLRVAAARGQIPASLRWLRQQMEEGVPRKDWEKALLLLPQTEQSLLGKLFGGRR